MRTGWRAAAWLACCFAALGSVRAAQGGDDFRISDASRKKLAKKVSVAFTARPLTEAAAALGGECGLKVAVDASLLREGDPAVTFRLDDVPAERALDWLALSLGAEWCVKNGVATLFRVVDRATFLAHAYPETYETAALTRAEEPYVRRGEMEFGLGDIVHVVLLNHNLAALGHDLSDLAAFKDGSLLDERGRMRLTLTPAEHRLVGDLLDRLAARAPKGKNREKFEKADKAGQRDRKKIYEAMAKADAGGLANEKGGAVLSADTLSIRFKEATGFPLVVGRFLTGEPWSVDMDRLRLERGVGEDGPFSVLDAVEALRRWAPATMPRVDSVALHVEDGVVGLVEKAPTAFRLYPVADLRRDRRKDVDELLAPGNGQDGEERLGIQPFRWLDTYLIGAPTVQQDRWREWFVKK